MRLAALFAILPVVAFADPPVVERVAASGSRFDVTLSHPDTGWDHYADGWEVRLHDGVATVFVYAKDNRGDWTPDGTPVDLN